MRVIAGELGGRLIQAPSGRATRPTSDRVREALFAMLGEIAASSVLDLFAGSGALGIEALSRGAARAVFVERDALALRALGANLGSLGLAAPRAQVRAARTRSRRSGAHDGVKRHTISSSSIRRTLRRATGGLSSRRRLRRLLAAAARVIVESDRRAPLQLDMHDRARAALRRHNDQDPQRNQ